MSLWRSGALNLDYVKTTLVRSEQAAMCVKAPMMNPTQNELCSAVKTPPETTKSEINSVWINNQHWQIFYYIK